MLLFVPVLDGRPHGLSGVRAADHAGASWWGYHVANGATQQDIKRLWSNQ
jgi:hypothetical protein